MRKRPYRFANKFWVDYLLVGSSISSTILRLVSFSFLPWLVGLIIAIIADRFLEYLKTPAFYLGSVGIFLTAGGLAYGSIKQYAIFDQFLACFDLDRDEQEKIVCDTLGKYTSLRIHIRSFLIIFIMCAMIAVAGFILWPSIEQISNEVGTKLPRFNALSQHGWYDVSVQVHSLWIVLVFAFFVTLPLSTAISVTLRLPSFLWRVSQAPVLLPPLLIKAHFAPAASFYTTVSIIWIFGVLLIAYFVGMNEDWLSYFVVVIFFVSGVIIFATPQIIYARVASSSEEVYFDLLSQRILATSHSKEEFSELDDTRAKILENMFEYGPAASYMTHDRWVYPLHQTYIVVAAYLVSLLVKSGYLKSLVSTLFGSVANIP